MRRSPNPMMLWNPLEDQLVEGSAQLLTVQQIYHVRTDQCCMAGKHFKPVLHWCNTQGELVCRAAQGETDLNGDEGQGYGASAQSVVQEMRKYMNDVTHTEDTSICMMNVHTNIDSLLFVRIDTCCV